MIECKSSTNTPALQSHRVENISLFYVSLNDERQMLFDHIHHLADFPLECFLCLI